MFTLSDYTVNIPTETIVGSITDPETARTAVQRAHCVIHLAAVISVTTFPKVKVMREVNVKGDIHTSYLLCISFYIHVYNSQRRL